MNPRILKKLSKRAAPLLPLLGEHRDQFRAVAFANYHSVFMPDRKHWERSPCHPTHEPYNRWTTPRGMSRRCDTRDGRSRLMSPPCHPLRGTIMVGGVSGYYEPEWDETTAYEALKELLFWHFYEWDENYEDGDLTRPLATPTQVFAAAAIAVAEVREGKAWRDDL